MRRFILLFLLVAFWLSFSSERAAAKPKECLSAEAAAIRTNTDLCIDAHIYEVVELPDGTRFLDTCPPDIADEDCRFTIISYREDRDLVGELIGYRNREVRIRGIVHSIRGRSEMILSHARQFRGGAPRFRPNPLLSRGFDASNSRAPLADPNLRPQGHARGFMNNRNRENILTK